MIKYRYRPERHSMPVKNHDVERFVQDRYKNKNLFLYLHRVTGKWVISEWRPGCVGQWMEDIVVLGKNMDKNGRPMGPGQLFSKTHVSKMDYLLLAPFSPDAINHLKTMDKDHENQMIADRDHEEDVRRHLAQKNDDTNNPAYTRFTKD